MQSRYRIVLIEDEPPALERLAKLVQKLDPGIAIVASLDSVELAMEWFSENPAPDLILSDIRLGDGNSFQIFEKYAANSAVIFTTSWDEYAIRAFKLHSIDYLLKPLKPEELEKAWQKFLRSRSEFSGFGKEMQHRLLAMLEEIQSRKEAAYKERFLVQQAGQLLPVPVSEIAYFFTRNDWVCLCTRDGRQFLVEYRLDELENLLDPKHFFRLNRQLIASLAAIEKARNQANGRLQIELLPALAEEVFVSREKAAAFLNWWEG